MPDPISVFHLDPQHGRRFDIDLPAGARLSEDGLSIRSANGVKLTWAYLFARTEENLAEVEEFRKGLAELERQRLALVERTWARLMKPQLAESGAPAADPTP